MLTTLQKAGALALLPDLVHFDCMSLSLRFYKVYGERIDWHDFASYLDQLLTKGLVEIQEYREFRVYRLS